MSVPRELTGAHMRRALAELGWTSGMLADAAHLSVVEVEKVLDDHEPLFNAVLNCVRAFEAAGIRFELVDRAIQVIRVPR